MRPWVGLSPLMGKGTARIKQLEKKQDPRQEPRTLAFGPQK